MNPVLKVHVDLLVTLASLEILDQLEALACPATLDHEAHKDHADHPATLDLLVLKVRI